MPRSPLLLKVCPGQGPISGLLINYIWTREKQSSQLQNRVAHQQDFMGGDALYNHEQNALFAIVSFSIIIVLMIALLEKWIQEIENSRKTK